MRGDRILAVLGLALGAATSTGAQPNAVRPLRATFLGVSTILVDDGNSAIMIDGFFSRPGTAKTLVGKIAPDTARIDSALNKVNSLTGGGANRIAAVLVAHSHHDHAMDAPVVAGKNNAIIVGSKSSANIARGLNFPEPRIREAKGGETYTFGDFTVHVISSPHSPDELFRDTIYNPLRPPAYWSNYKSGDSNFSFLIEHQGRRVLIHSSANFQPNALRGQHADVVFLGIGMLGKQDSTFIDTYWREVVQATQAKLVIPIHWDNFSKPLAQPLKRSPWPIDDIKTAMRALTRLAEASNATLRMPDAFETIDLSTAPASALTPRATPPRDR